MNVLRAEPYRIAYGPMASKQGDNFGMFKIDCLTVICAPTDEQWQHVSVSHPNRCPTWEEMCMVKNLFWDEEEIAVQFHPAKSEYVNCHPYCLHLWSHRCLETPPTYLIGPKL